MTWVKLDAKNPPKSLKELVEGDASQKIVLEDPRTSTPGLGFLFWMRSVYGDQTSEAWKMLSKRSAWAAPWCKSDSLPSRPARPR